MSNHDNLAERVRLGEDTRLELELVEIEGERVRNPELAAFADELAAMLTGGEALLFLE